MDGGSLRGDLLAVEVKGEAADPPRTPPGRETVSGTTAARRSDPLTLARFNPNPDPDMEVRGELLTC